MTSENFEYTDAIRVLKTHRPCFHPDVAGAINILIGANHALNKNLETARHAAESSESQAAEIERLRRELTIARSETAALKGLNLILRTQIPVELPDEPGYYVLTDREGAALTSGGLVELRPNGSWGVINWSNNIAPKQFRTYLQITGYRLAALDIEDKNSSEEDAASPDESDQEDSREDSREDSGDSLSDIWKTTDIPLPPWIRTYFKRRG